ncbi:helix-turn-helix domain-containing protein [Streptomyces griseoloalbus]|uniref:helix-turn-helix domain-containing protein n=1 Tax=Streptomyces griseoloalbus TaxID=67303 RepID=UPI0016189EB7|nr:helix-turn-helix domain-containing protein [Streptomyces albaduncus]GGW47369.1 NACHT domain-containing protein [Streptomyces albaduncus]
MTDELGALLRRLRKRTRLTQEQLAERSTVSVRTIRRLETGRSTDHRLRTLHLLADALDVGTEERRQLTDTLGRAQQGAAVEPPEPAPAESRGPAPTTPAESRGPAPTTPADPPAGGLADAAALLAREVRRRWQREEGHRRVHDPFPLPVRWQPVPAELMDRPENIQRLPPGATPQGLHLSGDLRSVVETYRSIASGRLVILGRAGSGKSVLAIKFALDLLAAPAAPSRVPVIFSIGSWDPTTTTLRDLLVDRLLRDHPHLARQVPSGSTLAAALVDADLILPVLDGFDEIAEALRAAALETLNATSLPLVLTSRRDEYARAVRAVHAPLVWAAGIELTDLTVKDLAAYLPRTDRLVAHGGEDGGAGVWDAVLERLSVRNEPASTQLAEVLRTPLMVILARTMYSEAPGKDPAELLDTARFPTASHLEEHLLAGFVPTVYRHRAPERVDAGRRQRNRDPDQVQRWLGYLAHSLTQGAHDQQDLAWWRLGQNLRVSTRVLHTVLVSALCMAMATWLVQLLATASGHIEPAGLGPSLLYGLLVGMFSGAAFGVTYFALAVFGRTTVVPSRVRLRLSAADRRAGRRPVRTFFTRFGFMLLGGSVLGIGYSWAVALVSVLAGELTLSHTELMKIVLINTLLYGLIIGLTAGLVFGLLAAFEAPMDITAAATPIRLLSVNRTTVGRQLLVLAPALGLGVVLCGYVVVYLFQGLLGTLLWPLQGAVLLGTAGGLGGTTAYVLAFTAWGQWLTLSRVWLPMTRRLPWDTVAFLEDAYHRGVLRQAGAVYQFRHIRLQRHLAQSYRHRHTDRAPDDAGQDR